MSGGLDFDRPVSRIITRVYGCARPRARRVIGDELVRVHNRDVYVRARDKRGNVVTGEYVLQHEGGTPLRHVSPISHRDLRHLERAREWAKVNHAKALLAARRGCFGGAK